MKKQYVLEEDEYYSICSQLERVHVDLVNLHFKISSNGEDGYKIDFALLSDKINGLTKKLGYNGNKLK